MATKTISITEDAYNKLLRMKSRERESFSEVIVKISSGKSILELKGILSRESADSLEKSIFERRKLNRNVRKKRDKEIEKDLKNGLH